jgi:hypothetical protein
MNWDKHVNKTVMQLPTQVEEIPETIAEHLNLEWIDKLSLVHL